MKVTNLKTKETYELSKDAATRLANSKLGKLYSFEKAAPTPPEISQQKPPIPTLSSAAAE